MTVILEAIAKNVCTILINRPSKRNAINPDTFKKLLSALKQFEDDDRFKVAIIGGVGGNFCSGYDLSEIVKQENGLPNMEAIESMLLPTRSRLSSKKITIAAIDGYAAGFGFELALRCDFRVAERGARMGFLNRRFGIPILNGGTVILPKLIGFPRAQDLIATGRAHETQEAINHGSLFVVCDVGCRIGRSLNLARNLSKFPHEALVHDMNQLAVQYADRDKQLLESERARSLEYLRKSGPLELAVRFVKGELCRHGNTDLGNLIGSEPEVTL